MTIAELEANGALYFANIKAGFDRYSSERIQMTAEEAGILFRNMWIEAGKCGAFVDFYYFGLRPEERKQAESVLTEPECRYLRERMQKLAHPYEEIIFPLDEILLSIVLKWNESAMLFSTIYFLEDLKRGREASTWWGNYCQEYIVFRKTQIADT